MSIIENLLHSNSNERLRQMLEAIKTRDFSLQYNLDNLSGGERALAAEINDVINKFRDSTLEQQKQYEYFETLLNTVSAMLIVTSEKGRVRWMNKPAIKGLCGFKIKHINDLSSISPTLCKELQQLRPGVQQQVRYASNGVQSDYVASVVHFFTKGMSLKLYSLQDVQTVVQKSETEAQQQLVRVLTHEIMNSLTPIISLSDTLCDGIGQGTLTHEETLMALQAIHRRSSGLMQFVENYRKLQYAPAPQYSAVVVGDLVADLRTLFPAMCFSYNIEDPEMEVKMDRSQIEQVLINLLKNAQESTADTPEPKIVLSVRRSNTGRELTISVTDNGRGILPDVMDRIFVPFFTTKQGGSGIGLSICKQIVSQHCGTITVSSVVDKETTFNIVLPL